MYQFSYNETLDGGAQTARERERDVIARSIELLRKAETKGARSREAIEALLYTRRVWSVLIGDLAAPENDLPETLRADIISIGLWIMRECESIRTEQSENFQGVIEVSQIILEGLK